ncbi:malonate--CoA ligase ACSF3, mitochondrial [Danaus plexippus]|uniref:malonate--CoA ligase ACSF3, mitochondrial n=1 Tax=Danaus plexippus TaxID=13037 RepID=UPI002AB28C03|nr:malonate--CoA ligase ACSF3, mitochondrial [Danaus plexippus]
MEISMRSVRLLNRLFRKPLSFSRTISNTAVKEEINAELLNSFNHDIKKGGVVPVFRRALLFPTRVALQDDFATYTYADLYDAATALSKEIAALLLGETERSICYMCNNDANHVIVQWAIWMTGNIAVPLTPLHPEEMLKYFIMDSDSKLIICANDFEKVLKPIAKELSKPILLSNRSENSEEKKTVLQDVDLTNKWYGDNEAMLIYTSGTTSKPKGVVWSHRMLSIQIAALHTAWKYSAHDVVLHTLPLHHIHGQLNSLNATMAAGARIRMLPKFTSHTVWAKLLDSDKAKVSVFHGVPSMYSKLAADYDKMFSDSKTAAYVKSTLSSRMRLMCAGSAPLPESLFKKWEEISGLKLLERYGMSEVGMALSNPYRPLEGRLVGRVGVPLPGVSARIAEFKDNMMETLVDVTGDMPDLQISLDKLGLTGSQSIKEFDNDWKVNETKLTDNDVCEGELLLKGPAVFTRYWNRAPSAFSSDFTSDGWFRTGDMASFSQGTFKIMGRTSVDIIKTGGYKVSALQVESALLEHPDISDVAVLGIPDQHYGEIVSAVVALKEGRSLTLRELKDEAGKRLAPYQLPKTMVIVDQMPRNAMGKLDKKLIRQQFGEKLVFKQ